MLRIEGDLQLEIKWMYVPMTVIELLTHKSSWDDDYLNGWAHEAGWWHDARCKVHRVQMCNASLITKAVKNAQKLHNFSFQRDSSGAEIVANDEGD